MKWYHFSVLIFLLVFISSSAVTNGGKIYKWIDEKGVVHFSDRPPANREDIKGDIEERELRGVATTDKTAPIEKNPSPRSPVEFAANATFTIKGSGNMGSGFFISQDGYAATCRHVIEKIANPVALLNDQTELALKIIFKSHRYDLALLLVMTPQKVSHLKLRDSNTLIPGDQIFAIGASAGLQATVTDGVFTGIRKIDSVKEEVLQFSAPINPGNSGGPLIDSEGNVVGVVSSKYMMREGVPVSGVGFAIPSIGLEEEFTEYME